MAGQGRRRAQRSEADYSLVELGAELRRLRARCRRLKLNADIASTTAAWEQWSEEVDGLDALLARIAKSSISTMQDIAIRYQALAVELIDGDLVLDLGTRRRVARLNRDLQQLVKRNS